MKTKHTENFMSRQFRVETGYVNGDEVLETFVTQKRVMQIERETNM